MKNLVFAFIGLILLNAPAFSQGLQDPKGEVRLNFLNTIFLGSVELGYEKFVSNDQSIGVELHLNDRFGYSSGKDDRDFSVTSALASYNFYFAGDENGRVYVSPFFKYRFGEYVKTVDNITKVTNMNSAYIGLIGGYRWNFNNFAFGPFASISRGFSQEVANEFSAVEFKAGFNVGYRF
ncbi:DUF3575 domain-containing protein [Aquiflexum sp.]|uniref:DUF3575 domain-containing protein n=1 Tax=Aquiflexum sp. TaxID=1872584 RepID=UPI003593EC11